jgi:hypothetical protein
MAAISERERITQRLTTIIDLEIAKLPARAQLWAYAEVIRWVIESVQYIAETRGRRSALTGRPQIRRTKPRPSI